MTQHDLEQLTNAGVCVFDLNAEYLAKTNWFDTSLGPRTKWPPALCNYVNLIEAFPHPAAVFWGPKLAIIHNIAWGSASNYDDGQSTPAADWYKGEARGSLQSAIAGRTVRVAGSFFFKSMPHHAPDAPVLVCPLLDDKGHRQGVLAQLLHDPLPHGSLDNELLGNGPKRDFSRSLPHKSQNNDILAKSEEDQENILRKVAMPSDSHGSIVDAVSNHDHMDSKQSQLFQRFAELLPTGLAILDHNAEAVFVNDQFFHLTTKKSSHEFRSWPESIDPRDYERVMGQYREAFGERQEIKVEFRCVIGDDGEKPEGEEPETGEWRMFFLKPLDAANNAGYICAVVDISELKSAEHAQERAAQDAKDRKQQQERFIDMVSHEIRNPLSAVLHLAEEIKQTVMSTKGPDISSDQAAEIIDAADTILICVSHQNVLVDDILAFSKLDSMMLSLAPSLSQPKWAFSKQLKVFQAELKTKHIEFEFALDVSVEDLGVDWVLADLARIKQVLVNLMTNAIKFTAHKAGDRRITVAMGASTEKPLSYPPNVVFFEENDSAPHVDQTLAQDWGDGPVMYLMLVVKDTGIGISKENQVKLFERFRQATPKTSETYGGSGLGLSISRKLCQLHGGDIGVASKKGQGSTFGFYFKVRRASPPSDEDAIATVPSLLRRQMSSHKSISPIRPRILGQGSHRTPIEEVDEGGKDSEKKKRKKKKRNSQQSQSMIRNMGDQKEAKDKAEGEHRDPDPENSLNDPPVRYEPEVHPGSKRDSRTAVTEEVVDGLQSEAHSSEKFDEEAGETPRQARVAKQTHDAQTKSPCQIRGTLLLVEDNLINQKVLKRQLQNYGFQVFTANNGQEAVDAVIKRAKDARASDKDAEGKDDERFLCILMDQEMPIKDGNTAAREIKELQKNGEVGRSPIMGVSANVREEQTRSMRDAGMDDVISKPFKVVDLVKKIKALVEERPARAKETETSRP